LIEVSLNIPPRIFLFLIVGVLWWTFDIAGGDERDVVTTRAVA
jgi:hypothetical protein